MHRLGVRQTIRYIALFLYTLSYLLLQTHPWYNSTGAFLLLACARLAMSKKKWVISLSGILAGLTILTKQDFGGLSFLIAILFIVTNGLGDDSGKLVYVSRDHKKKESAKIIN
mgnify:CR=1 FL=1